MCVLFTFCAAVVFQYVFIFICVVKLPSFFERVVFTLTWLHRFTPGSCPAQLQSDVLPTKQLPWSRWVLKNVHKNCWQRGKFRCFPFAPLIYSSSPGIEQASWIKDEYQPIFVSVANSENEIFKNKMLFVASMQKSVKSSTANIVAFHILLLDFSDKILANSTLATVGFSS